MMSKDSEVEVFPKENGLVGVWVRAVLTENPNKSGRKNLRVRYKTRLSDDGVSPRTELVEKRFIRPVPPEDMQNGVVLEEGTVVDADERDGYWTGFILKKKEESEKFHVCFDSPPLIIEYERNQLRPHLDWVDSRWVVPVKKELYNSSVFCSGEMVEVCSVKDKTWYPTLLVEEIKGDGQNRFIVKDFSWRVSSSGGEATALTIAVDACRVRPAPPPSSVGEYESMERVEALRGSGWRQGLVIKLLPGKRYCVRLDVSREEYVFKHSELRPLMVWENGIWRDDEPKQKTPSNILNKNPTHSCSDPKPLAKFKTDAPTAELRKQKKKAEAVISDKTSAVVNTPSATTLLQQTKAKTVGNTYPMRTPEPVMNDSTPHKTPEEENSRKRKWELVDGSSNTSAGEISDTTSKSICHGSEVVDQTLSTELSADQSLNVVKSSAVAATCTTPARDALMDLPFPKMLPYWKSCESSDGFKSVPQRPHFRPLLESIDNLDLRESAAVGMMVTFYDLLKEVKGLKLDDSASRLDYLRDAFAKLDKNGFEVEAYQAVISKVLSLKDMRAKKEEEQKCFEDSIKEEESGSLKLEELRLELQGKISELERQDAVAKMKKEAAEKKMADMKAHVGMISQEIEDVEVEFQKTISAPW